METRSLDNVIADLRNDQTIPADARLRLLEQLYAVPSPLQSDRWIYRGVVLVLGTTALATVIGGLVIYGMSAATIPGEIVALGSAAVGALAGLLAPSPLNRQT